MRASTLLLAVIAAVLVVGGVALAALSPGGAGNNRSGDIPTATTIPEAPKTASTGSGCCEVSENSIGVVSYRKIIVPASLLRNLRLGTNTSLNTSTSILLQRVVIRGVLETAYGNTLVLNTSNGVIRIVVPKEWRWRAAKYDLVGLFAEGILAKNMDLTIDAVKIGYKGLAPYIVVGYRITLPSGTIIESDLPING